MEQFLLEVLGSATGPASYLLVFGVLLACGLGFPLPEDVALITGGYLAHLGHADVTLMCLVGFGGIIAGDSIVFFLGRASRLARGSRPGGLLARHLTPERIAKVEAQFERRGSSMVMIARFLPGVRAATFFVAGGAQMPYGRFIFYDGLAALLSAPLFVVAGHAFGDQIGVVVAWAERFHSWLIAGMVIAALAFGIRAFLRRGKRAPAPQLEASPLPLRPLEEGQRPVEEEAA